MVVLIEAILVVVVLEVVVHFSCIGSCCSGSGNGSSYFIYFSYHIGAVWLIVQSLLPH